MATVSGTCIPTGSNADGVLPLRVRLEVDRSYFDDAGFSRAAALIVENPHGELFEIDWAPDSIYEQVVISRLIPRPPNFDPYYDEYDEFFEDINGTIWVRQEDKQWTSDDEMDDAHWLLVRGRPELIYAYVEFS